MWDDKLYSITASDLQNYAIWGTGSRFDFFFVFFGRIVGISIVPSFLPPVMDFATLEGSISIFSTDMSASMSVTFVMACVNSCTNESTQHGYALVLTGNENKTKVSRPSSPRPKFNIVCIRRKQNWAILRPKQTKFYDVNHSWQKITAE